jgi:HD superfamily phosphohydrolase
MIQNNGCIRARYLSLCPWLHRSTAQVENFFKSHIEYPDRFKTNTVDLFFQDIGKMIVGAFLDEEEIPGHPLKKKYYMTQIINGQFDADKLDYIRRDSYTAGLALTYDIERLLYKIKIHEIREGSKGEVQARHLTMPVTGIAAIEEMLFSQLMLNSYIYQHQKVLATDSLINDVVEGLSRNEKLAHPCDYLNYCDDDIFRIWSGNTDEDFKVKISEGIISSASVKTLSDMVRRVKNRELPKRALIINFSTVEGLEDDKLLNKAKYKVADIADQLKRISELRQEICNESIKISDKLAHDEGGGKPIDYYDIHIVIPRTDIAKNLGNAFVVSYENELVKLSDIVRLKDWADAFSYHKWNAYVFAKAEITAIVSIASKVVLERNGIKFDSNKVFSNLKKEARDEIKKIIRLLKNKYDYDIENLDLPMSCAV